MGGVELFTAYAKLFLEKAGFDRDAAEADKTGKTLADNLGGYMEKAKKVIAGLFSVAAIKKGAEAVWDLAKTTAAAGDRIDKQSQALGLSRKAYQEWDYILSQSGASIDDMGLSMKTMTAAIMENSAETAAGLSKLGLSAAQLQSMSPEDQFEALVKAFQQMPAGAEKSQLAIKLFGRNAQSLMPLLNSSADSVDELRKRAQELGLIMDDDAVDASVAFGDALDDLTRTWDALKMKFGAQLLPGFTKGLIEAANSLGRISTALTGAFKTGDFATFFRVLTDEVSRLVPGVIDTALNVVNGIFENADKLIGLAASIISGLASGIIKSIPILLRRLPGIISTIWEELKELVKNLGNDIIDVINEEFGTNIPHIDEIRWPTWAELQEAFGTAWSLIQTEAEKLMKLVFGETEDGGIKWPTWADLEKAFTTAWGLIQAEAENLMKLVFGENENGGIKWPSWSEVQTAFETAWNAIKAEAENLMKLVFGTTEDGGIKWPTWGEISAAFDKWWNGEDGIASKIKDAAVWVLQIFGLPEADAEKIATDVGNWFSGFVDVLVEACSWVLGLFGLPTNVDTAQLAQDVSNWFGGFVDIIANACNWVLNLFGLPEVDTSTLATDVSNWFGGFSSFIIDACSWVLGLFGLPTDVDTEKLSADVSTWFDGYAGVLESACKWVLQLFGMPEEDAETVSGLVSGWWSGIMEAVQNACGWVLSIFGFGNDTDYTKKFSEWWNGEDGNGGMKKLITDTANWVLGKLGFPDVAKIQEQIREWWAGVVKDLGLSVLFGVAPEGSGSGGHEGDSGMIHGGGGHGFAKGLNYVPFDGYAYLHRGETVLNQAQAREWRQGDGGIDTQALYSAVAAAVASAVSGIQINMDGTAVGNAVTQQVSQNIYQAQLGRRYSTAW